MTKRDIRCILRFDCLHEIEHAEMYVPSYTTHNVNRETIQEYKMLKSFARCCRCHVLKYYSADSEPFWPMWRKIPGDAVSEMPPLLNMLESRSK